MSDYGDDESVPESEASLYQEKLEEEAEKKKGKKKDESDDELDEDITDMDKFKLFEAYKGKIFQDVSNDKLFILELKKSKAK